MKSAITFKTTKIKFLKPAQISQLRNLVAANGRMKWYVEYQNLYGKYKCILAYSGDRIVGWSVIEDKVISIFVKKSYRRRGIGSKLLEIQEKKNPNIFCGPYLKSGINFFAVKNYNRREFNNYYSKF